MSGPTGALINGSQGSNNNMVLHQPTAKVLVVEDEMMLRMRAVDIVEDAVGAISRLCAPQQTFVDRMSWNFP
jgi:hypothetical protein